MADKKELLLIEIREDGARVVKRRIGDIGETGNQVTDQMGKLKTVLAGLISARALRDTIMLADAYANMLNRLRVVTVNYWELNAAMAAVFNMSRETRTSLEANIDMYSRIAINTKQMGLEMKDMIRFATQLNHAIILSGVTAREAQWGMVQFSQGLAAGALRGDELRAVMEQLPIVTQTLTRYLGIGRGELRKWAFEGRVTTKVIIDAFNDAEKSLAERFGKRIPTVDQAITVLHNTIVEFIGSVDQSIQGTSNLALAILWVGDNMHTFGKVVAVAGGFLGAIFLKNLLAIVAQMRLFNLSILAAHPLATVLLAAGAAAVVFSNKIKIAKDSTATLADFMGALGDNAKETYKILRDGLAGILDQGGEVHSEYAVTFETILKDAASFIDKFLGFFVGAGEVIKKVIGDIPGNAKGVWNMLMTDLETVKDFFVAVLKSIGDMFTIFSLNVQSGMGSIAGAAEQLMAGNAAKAREYGEQAALSFKNAAAAGFKGFGDILDKNLREAASEDSLSGAKFKVEKAGESLGEAFKRGFGMSDFISGGVDQLLERAKTGGDTGGPSDKPEVLFHPTPTQSKMLKDMIGDVGAVNSKMQQLRELWTAINTQQPGTEGMALTLDQVNRKMDELKLKSLETNTDVMAGFKRGFIQLGLELSNFADLAEKTISNAFKGMEDALVSFVTTGKVNFKSLVDGMLADLTRLLARQAIMALLKSLANSSGGGGIIGSIAGALGGAAEGGGGTGAKALGGPVSPGMSYLVGERQPEIFTPAQPGQITPMSQASAAPAAMGDVVIINVSSEEEALAAMGSSEGKRIIRNEIRTSKEGT